MSKEKLMIQNESGNDLNRLGRLVGNRRDCDDTGRDLMKLGLEDWMRQAGFE